MEKEIDAEIREVETVMAPFYDTDSDWRMQRYKTSYPAFGALQSTLDGIKAQVEGRLWSE